MLFISTFQVAGPQSLKLSSIPGQPNCQTFPVAESQSGFPRTVRRPMRRRGTWLPTKMVLEMEGIEQLLHRSLPVPFLPRGHFNLWCMARSVSLFTAHILQTNKVDASRDQKPCPPCPKLSSSSHNFWRLLFHRGTVPSNTVIPSQSWTFRFILESTQHHPFSAAICLATGGAFR